MMDVLNFIFQDFWHWLGTFILLGVIFGGLGQMCHKKTTIITNDKPENDRPKNIRPPRLDE
jgi:hypothetical protein